MGIVALDFNNPEYKPPKPYKYRDFTNYLYMYL